MKEATAQTRTEDTCVRYDRDLGIFVITDLTANDKIIHKYAVHSLLFFIFGLASVTISVVILFGWSLFFL